jgi:hypothetical protein
MDVIYFFVRHIPFWAIPLIFVCVEFGYLYWLKDEIAIARNFGALAGFAFICLVYYYIAGGPENSVNKIINLIH